MTPTERDGATRPRGKLAGAAAMLALEALAIVGIAFAATVIAAIVLAVT
jgi:hypothetical protein